MRPAGGSWLTKSEPCLGLAVALAERIATWYIVGSKERKKGRHKVAAGLSRAWKCGEVTKPECVAGGIIEGHISARVPCVVRADMRIAVAHSGQILPGVGSQKRTVSATDGDATRIKVKTERRSDGTGDGEAQCADAPRPRALAPRPSPSESVCGCGLCGLRPSPLPADGLTTHLT